MKYPVVTRSHIVPPNGSPAAVAQAPAPESLAASGGLHVHGGMIYSGSATDVQSITFQNGMTLNVTGAGDPVTIDAGGLHFNAGKYLSVPLTSAYTGFAAFAAITVKTDALDKVWQYPINLTGSGVNVLSFRANGSLTRSDGGANYTYPTLRPRWLVNQRHVFGTCIAARDDGPEAQHTLWQDGIQIGGTIPVTHITPTACELGRDFTGTIHEGIVFAQVEAAPDPLYPPGVTSNWICSELAA